jgi:xanthine phosphoribosyltransferase
MSGWQLVPGRGMKRLRPREDCGMTATPEPRKSFPVSWEALHRDAKALAWRLLELGPWKGMVAVTRGGLAPAAIVARALDVRLIETVCVIGYQPDDYNPQQANQTTVIKPPAHVGDGEGWLVVDDLVDTGRTAEVLRKLMPKAHIATIYAKPLGRPLVDTYVTEVSQDTWIYFPWESGQMEPMTTRKNGRTP